MDVKSSSTKAPTAIVSLLEVLDGPAVLLDASCRVLGANAQLLALASSLGVPLLEDAPDLVPALAPHDLPESPGVIVGRTLELRDGGTHEARLLRLEGIGSGPLVLLLFEPLCNETESASDRRSSRLRHDLAGPLTAILGTAELLLMREERLEGDAREALEEILGQCSRISELIARDRAGSAEEADETP